MFVAFSLVGIAIVVCLVQTLAFRRLYTYVDRELARPDSGYRPKVCVILPCKGLDPGFVQNIERLLKQNYANFEVIFSVASKDDPAYKALIQTTSDSVATKTVIAGFSTTRAQKINNQLRALEEVPPDTEVLVFVDSDVIARTDFLARLIAPLSDSAVGVTTGYRFYISSLGNLPSQLRSLWNRVSAWEMASPSCAFAWGGAMAIRRSVFEKAGVRAAWDRAADDDLSLTTAVKALGLAVHFVPQCLVASDGDADIKEIFDWTNRQLILTKVYYPKLWHRAISRACIMAVWLISVIFATIGWAFTHDPWLGFAMIAGLGLLPLELIFMVLARRLWQRVLTENSQYIRDSFLTSCASLPLAHLVLPWLTLFSVFTNRIQWRGIKYELLSPTETLVIPDVIAPQT